MTGATGMPAMRNWKDLLRRPLLRGLLVAAVLGALLRWTSTPWDPMVGVIESIPVLIAILIALVLAVVRWHPNGWSLTLGVIALAAGYAVGPLNPDANHHFAGRISIGLVSNPGVDWIAEATCNRRGSGSAVDFVSGSVTVDGVAYGIGVDLSYVTALTRPDSGGSDPNPTVFVGVGRAHGQASLNGADRFFSMSAQRLSGHVETDPVGAGSGPDIFGNVAGPFEQQPVRVTWSCSG
jgi:hypothetical protein